MSKQSWKRVFPSYRDRTRFSSSVRRWASRLGLDERSLRERYPHAQIFRQLDKARAALRSEMAELFGHLKGMKFLSAPSADFACQTDSIPDLIRNEDQPPIREVVVPDPVPPDEETIEQLLKIVMLKAQGEHITRSEGAGSDICPIDAADSDVIENYIATHPVSPEPSISSRIREDFPPLEGIWGSNRELRREQIRDYRDTLTSSGISVRIQKFGEAKLKEDFKRLNVALGVYGPRSGYHGPTKDEYVYVRDLVRALKGDLPPPKLFVMPRHSSEHDDLADLIRNLPD